MEERAPPLLAITRIICVLGMSFFIALAIFLLLWGKLLPTLVSLLLSLPFFAVMAFMEKRIDAADR